MGHGVIFILGIQEIDVRSSYCDFHFLFWNCKKERIVFQIKNTICTFNSKPQKLKTELKIFYCTSGKPNVIQKVMIKST